MLKVIKICLIIFLFTLKFTATVLMLKLQYVHLSNFPYMCQFLSSLNDQFLCLLPDTLFFLKSFYFFQKHELLIRRLLHRLQAKKKKKI